MDQVSNLLVPNNRNAKCLLASEFDVLTEMVISNYDVIINTAILTEMGNDSIEYYIQNIARMKPSYFYSDNHRLMNIQI